MTLTSVTLGSVSLFPVHGYAWVRNRIYIYIYIYVHEYIYIYIYIYERKLQMGYPNPQVYQILINLLDTLRPQAAKGRWHLQSYSGCNLVLWRS